MSLTHQKQMMFAIIMFLILFTVVIIGLVSFEVAQHFNTIWHLMHGFSGTAFVSRHP